MKSKPELDAIYSDRVVCRMLLPKLNEKTPAAAELMFAAMHGAFDYNTKIQPTLSFEIVSINKFIQFYFDVPKYLKQFIEGQIYAQYPDVEISEVEDYAAREMKNRTPVGIDIMLVRDDVYPIKTFQNFDVDPLSGITGVLSQADNNEEIWIQICVSPSSDIWQKRSINSVKMLRAGRDPNEPVWKSILKGLVSGVGSAAKPGEAPASSGPADLSGPMQLAMKGIEEKAVKLGYETSIRVVSLAQSESRATQTLNSLLGALKQFTASNMNGFVAGRPVSGDIVIDLYRKREISAKPYILNIEELASFYHLPADTVETPTMSYAGSRKGEPPSNLPLIAGETNDEMTIVGKTNFRGEEKEFGIRQKDRALHMYAIGKTGTGKSTLLKALIIDDICKGRGVAVVDPHGDLIADVMEYIPENRINDVIFFSPADRDFPIGFNLFEKVDPEYKNIVASGIVGVFKKIFGESWGPRLEYILRNVVLGLLDYEGATLLSVLKILSDTKFRRGVVDKISDPIIRDFFVNEFEKYDQKFRTEAVAPIQNKVGQFVSSSTIRNIVGQGATSIDVRKAMDESMILLVDLSIGKIGEDNSALLGSLMITKIQMAAMTRASMPKEKRTQFYLYVDEFQNFATDSFAVILSEARKYGLSLMVTNQYIAQMPENVANAVFGNVGSLITFRVGAGDAEFLNREFVPVFEPSDLVNLDNYSIYLKMAINGVTSSPFSAKTVLTSYEPQNLQKEILEQSRIKYTRPREEVERIISEDTLGASTGLTPDEILGRDKEEKSVSTPAATETKMPTNNETAAQFETEEEISKGSSNLPEEIANVKNAEDYDLKKWFFLTRTGYRKAAGKEEPAENDEGSASSEPKDTSPATDTKAGEGEKLAKSEPVKQEEIVPTKKEEILGEDKVSDKEIISPATAPEKDEVKPLTDLT
jgi:hypothetical protein